ncbi:unnamed protein product [Clavelina lepadiformis]|uniref:Secreted protein n=1 Tax=Clavelina lepadiformis TaxID=159417 RepID=A0ABP0FYJ3_CLALP
MNSKLLLSLLIICFVAYAAEGQAPDRLVPASRVVYFWKRHYSYRIVRVCRWYCYCIRVNPFTFQSAAGLKQVSGSFCRGYFRGADVEPETVFETKD